MSDSATNNTGTANNTVNTNNSADSNANVNNNTNTNSVDNNVNTNGVDNNVNTNGVDGQKDTQTNDGLDNLFGNEDNKGNENNSNIPENYTFTDKDGNDLGLDAETTAGFTQAFKEIGLSQEQATKAFNLYVSDIQEMAEQFKTDNEQAQKQQIASWRKAIINDAELGGEHLKQTKQNIENVMNKFGNAELRQFLNSGAGYHPVLIRLLNNIGSQLSNDSNFINGKGGSQKTETSFERAKRLYPNSPSLWH